MKKLINAVDALLRESLDGFAAAHADLVKVAHAPTYVVRADALEGSVRLYRVARGRRAQIAAKQVAVASDRWHVLRTILKGEAFEVSLDDTPLFKATDASLPQPGAVGVWSQADSLILFGSLLVAPPP